MAIVEYVVQSGDTLSGIAPKLGYKDWEELRDANLAEILRVGRSQMAGRIGADVTRGPPCALPEHTDPKYSNHLIIKGVHYDGADSPTIYPGTTLFLKSKTEPPEEETETPQEVPPKEEPFRAREIHKRRWTGVERQTPGPKLHIFTQGNPETPDFTYAADPKDRAWSKLLGYNFSESVDDLEGSFSFTVENEEVDREGKTVFDLIPLRSVIKMYEGDLERPVFVGIIRRRHIGVSMTSQGVRRTITFSGKSIVSCVAEYTISLDVRIQGVADAMTKTKQLESGLAVDGLTIAGFVEKTWYYFRDISNELNKHMNGVSNTGIAEVIDRFMGTIDRFVTVYGKEQKLQYNIATVFFNQANNSIAEIWRNILPKPVYELFSYCDKADGKPKIMVRQVPYGDPTNGNDDWKGLDIYLISPISLTAYEVSQSDEEVYTAFASYVIGSAMSREFYMAVNQTGTDDKVRYNAEKVKLYGYKPLEISFNGYDRQGNTRNEKTDDLKTAIKKLNERAAYWYSRLDDMYAGSITICTDFHDPETNPRVGCRAKFMGGEFYITKTEHSWNYGGTPTIKLTVSRGMRYDEQGKMRDGAEGIIPKVGGRFRELERENI